MKDIKSLYLAAKSSGKQADISAYIEAIQELINDDPNGYITQLEYIISSDIGLKTVKPFIGKNGFPIACYDPMIDALNECVHKCEIYGKDASIYNEAINEFKAFRNKYINCFMMFENFKPDLNNNYVSTYYRKNEKGHQNRKLIAGMISKFGEAAIPDALITADSIGGSAVKTVLEFTGNRYGFNYKTIYEWLLTVSNDIKPENRPISLLEQFQENCLSNVVEKVKKREHQAYRESVILDNHNAMVEYSLDDITYIKDLITFKEYQMTWVDELTESVPALQNQIYELYEMLDGIVEEDAADLVGGIIDNPIKESLAIVNTRNKKTGEIPGYLADNHDISYGEEDPNKKKSSTADTTIKEPSLDDYRRPSAMNDDKPGTPLNLPSVFDNDHNTSTTSTSNVSEDDKRMINNYYYYTYNNSHNKNTNSFNKDNSVRDNHSSTTDDHSKVINSNNGSDPEYTLIPDTKPEDKPEEKDNEPKKESSAPWELNIFPKNESFVEKVGDADKDKPKSDHPIKDILTDLDRESTKKQQETKKKIQDIQNVGRAAMKPINRTKSWINKLVVDWKDKDENTVKERMADPKTRSNLFSAIKTAIIGGSLVKAGILFNPIILFLTVTRGVGKNKKAFRIRNEMISEIKTEMNIIDEKIKDADHKGDNAEKYKLMRFKNELNKKLIRVGGTKEMSKMI